MPGDKHEESSDSEEWSSKQYSLRVSEVPCRMHVLCALPVVAVPTAVVARTCSNAHAQKSCGHLVQALNVA